MTIFAYGQTSTGKTYTMQGNIPNNEGIIPQTIYEIFDKLKTSPEIINYKIKISFMEIYNENINDLLDNTKTNLELRETSNKEVIVNNLTEHTINNKEEAINLLLKGNDSRTVASTKLNEKSSRSHSIFRLNIEITKKKNFNDITPVKKNNNYEEIFLTSQINLIDLAGSENSNKTGCVGIRLKEGANINKSLLALSNVISKLSQNNGNNNIFVNYRDSKLTRLLQTSLGGNSKTIIICTITDDIEHYSETMNTLHFGNKAKNIKTIVKINEVKNQNCQQMLLENEKLKQKIKELEKELTTTKKLKVDELLNSKTNEKIDLTAPNIKVNFNNNSIFSNSIMNYNDKDDLLSHQSNINNNKLSSFNKTQLVLTNMEKQISLLKSYLLTDQRENNNNNFDTCSVRSSDIRRNLMFGNKKPTFNEIYTPCNQMAPQKNYNFSNFHSGITLCNVENFAINENENMVQKLIQENNKLKLELALLKNNGESLDLDENDFDKKNSDDYFLNKGRKILMSKISKIQFIKNFSDQMKQLGKKSNEDTQILIQLNQTIKNLNQNIINDDKNNVKTKTEKKLEKKIIVNGKENNQFLSNSCANGNNFLQRKKNIV